MNKIKAILVALTLLSVFGAASVSADSSDVTTTWIVPADTTIAISYPTGEGKIEFDAAGQNFTDLAATSQTGATAALTITNNGNTAVQIEARWTSDWPTGVSYVNISVSDNTNSTSLSYTDADETTNQTLVASLAKDGSESFWIWTTGNEVDETAGVDRTLRIYSTNT